MNIHWCTYVIQFLACIITVGPFVQAAGGSQGFYQAFVSFRNLEAQLEPFCKFDVNNKLYRWQSGKTRSVREGSKAKTAVLVIVAVLSWWRCLDGASSFANFKSTFSSQTFPTEYDPRYVQVDIASKLFIIIVIVIFIQIGVVSFGARRCASQGVPAVYARVANYLEWILNSTSTLWFENICIRFFSNIQINSQSNKIVLAVHTV